MIFGAVMCSKRSRTSDRERALQAVKAFEVDYGAKWPKAVAKITEHIDVLLAFYDYPAEDHTTTDSTLSIVRELRTDFDWLGTVLRPLREGQTRRTTRRITR
jgi:transposase-like protein